MFVYDSDKSRVVIYERLDTICEIKSNCKIYTNAAVGL